MNRQRHPAGFAAWAGGMPIGAIAFACVVFSAVIAIAQDRASRPADPAEKTEQAAPADDPAFRPGFLEALGRWIGDPGAIIDEQLKNTQDALDALGTVGAQATDAAKGAATAAQQATGAIIGLPGTQIVNGSERCTVAANGAPDCATAAQALCRRSGYGNGSGLDVKSTKKCPAWVWLSGRSPAPGDCTNETIVVRALCQ